MDYSKQEFERLFKDNYPHMYRMAFSMVENAEDAKDAVHQVFTQVWKGKPRVADKDGRRVATRYGSKRERRTRGTATATSASHRQQLDGARSACAESAL